MDRGRRLCETTGLENYGNDVRAVYWGGAVVSLLADVEARKRTAGARGLEDGLKALLARGGDARSVWRVDDAIRVIDEGIGTPVLAELASKYRFRGSPVPLDGVLADLGVVRGPSAVELRDDAPLAEVRRRITRGNAARAPAHTARTK
jgi:predicted metalloprotease with PDZ domain